MRKALSLVLALSGGAYAGIIIDVASNISSANQPLSPGSTAAAAAFSLSQGLNNATISANFAYSLGPKEFTPAPNINVLLLNQIGPGTTAANQIASTVVLPILTSDQTLTQNLVLLFSGLTLSSGNYYVVAYTETGNATWQGFLSPTTTMNTPAATFGFATASGGSFVPGYPPSSPFSDVGNPLGFRLTGDIVPTPGIDNPVPEPASWALMAAGLVALWRCRQSSTPIVP